MPDLPRWVFALDNEVFEDYTDGPPITAGTPLDELGLERPRTAPGSYFTLGLSLAPHEHGLLVRVVRGWVATNTALAPGNILWSVNGDSAPNWTGMINHLMRSRVIRIELIPRWPVNFAAFPESHNAHL